jgi:hypothetical protein
MAKNNGVLRSAWVYGLTNRLSLEAKSRYSLKNITGMAFAL